MSIIRHTDSDPTPVAAHTRWLRGRRVSAWALPAWLATVILVATVLFPTGCSDRLDEARSLEEAGDLKGAAVVYREMLAADPDDLDALKGLAAFLFLTQDFDAALPVQEKVVELDPDEVQTRLELGFNYLNHQERPGDAVGVFRQAAGIEPSARNLTYLAQGLREDGRLDEAEAALRSALETDPSYGYPYRVLLSVLRAQGDTAGEREVVADAERHGITLQNE